MNCKEFKIWLVRADESEILSLPGEIRTHVKECNACNEALNPVQSALNFIQQQKKFTLSDIKTNELIDKLSSISFENNMVIQGKNFRISKLAVAAVILFGMLTGAIIGGIIPTKNTSGNSVWSQEFTLLSDNTDADKYIFD